MDYHQKAVELWRQLLNENGTHSDAECISYFESALCSVAREAYEKAATVDEESDGNRGVVIGARILMGREGGCRKRKQDGQME